MRILIIGAGGQLGQVLVQTLAPGHEVTGVDVDDCDVTDAAQTMQVVSDVKPELVIHCAALTQVDYCAENPDVALWVNGYGTRHVALACQANGATLCHISTNEVFDGKNTGTYLEYDRTNPINPYAYSKWVAEQMVRELISNHYIVRPSWLIAHGGRNFVHAIRRRAEEGKPLRVVVNEVAVPTYAYDLADAIAKLIQTGRYGIYHLVNEGRVSRWRFARYILDKTGFPDTPIERISSYEYPRASTPPEYSVLRNFAAARLGITLRTWEEAVDAFLAADSKR
jgi:dTDP-4-dehydrorhamnose reductase